MFAPGYWGVGYYGAQHWPPAGDTPASAKRGAGVLVIEGYDRVEPSDIDEALANAFGAVDDAVEYLAKRPRNTAKVQRKVNAAIERVQAAVPALELQPFIAPDYRTITAAKARVRSMRAALQKEAVRRRREREAILVLML